MACALLGVMGMQLYFLVQTYDMQSKLFDRSIDDALNNVVAKVTKREALNFAHSRLIDSEKKSNKNLDITKPQ